MSQILDYKCPNCHGSLVFDVSLQKMKCGSCDSEMDMAAFKEFTEADKVRDGIDDLGEYSGAVWEGTSGQFCNSCNGELISCDNTIATECPYCGNTAIITRAVSDALRPDFVIPFKFTREAAKAQLTKLYKGKFLLPKCFKNNKHMDSVTGLYVPFWLYDCDTAINAAYNTTRVSSWVRGNTHFTKTDRFMVTRLGNMSFNKIPVEGSQKMSKPDMEAIEPFNYGDLSAFNPAFLAGHVAEKHDIDFAKQKPRVDSRIRKSADGAVDNTVRGYHSRARHHMNINVRNNKINYALLPVWVLSTRWRGKVYKFTMNGQTGKFAGELPLAKKKAFGLGAAITLVSALLSALLFMGAAIGMDNSPVFGFVGGLILGLLVGALISLIVIGLLAYQLKVSKRSKCAANYSGGFNLTHGNEIFLGSQIIRRPISTGNNMGMRGGRPGGFGGGFRR